MINHKVVCIANYVVMGYFIANLSVNFLVLSICKIVIDKMVDCVISPIRLSLLSSKMQNSINKYNNLFITDRSCY